MATDASQKRWSVLDLLNWTKDYFVRCELESPRLAAEILLASALNCKRVELYARFNAVPEADKLTKFREMVRRAADGEPVAYLVGSREFYSLPLKVSDKVLIPRPETETLVDMAIDRLRKADDAPRVWDICTGSGAVALAIAANTPETVSIIASDISSDALELAAQNAADNELSQRVKFAQADLFELTGEDVALADGGFDVITANPPYIRSAEIATLSKQVQREPRLALDGGDDGLDIIRRIVAGAPGIIKNGGLLAMEIGYDQADQLWDILNAAAGYSDIHFAKDTGEIDRIVCATYSGEADK